MTKQKRGRGRPASIDTKAALDNLVELFRAKGFAAVSLDDLSEVTGLSRPSLYRAFGNKLEMYIAAMDAFGAQVVNLAVPALRAEGDFATALSNFFSEMLNIYYRDDEITPGCLVFGTAPSNADEAAIQARLLSGIKQTDSMMRWRITEAAPDASGDQIETAVHLATNTLIAFSARAKAGASKQDLIYMGQRSAASIASLLKI